MEYDEEAVAIAENMPELQHLQLIGNKMTDDGLLTILNDCPYLESLGMRQCFNLRFGDGRIKVFGKDGAQALLESPNIVPTKFMQFMENQGFLIKINVDNHIEAIIDSWAEMAEWQIAEDIQERWETSDHHLVICCVNLKWISSMTCSSKAIQFTNYNHVVVEAWKMNIEDDGGGRWFGG
nr:F-box protein SKIP19-like [Ipomoea batatas]